MPTCCLKRAPHRATSAAGYEWSLGPTLESATSWKQEVFALSKQVIATNEPLITDLTGS